MTEWGIYRTEAPISVVFAVQPWNFVEFPLAKRRFMVDGLLSDIGIVLVLPIRPSPLATGVPVLPCTGTAPVALGVVE